MFHEPRTRDAAGQPDSGNLLTPLAGLLVIAIVALTMWGLGMTEGPLEDDMTKCAAVGDSGARLACFDKLSAAQQPAKGALAPFFWLPHERQK